jgi:hypothetical protein
VGANPDYNADVSPFEGMPQSHRLILMTAAIVINYIKKYC